MAALLWKAIPPIWNPSSSPPAITGSSFFWPNHFMPQSSFHVALIMDGNGRWAARSGLPRVAGHKAGADALRRVVEAAPACGITDLTAYAFSADNWTRPQEEVNVFMGLLVWHLDRDFEALAVNDLRTPV